MTSYPQLAPSERVLMGPGPSAVPIRVLNALAAPTLGHLDPEYLQMMDEIRSLLQTVFRTENELTLAVSGTGSAGMEACVVNLIEPGDEAIVCINGVFGTRMKDVMERAGANVHAVEIPWGESFHEDHIAKAVADCPDAKVLGIVHAETSTGAHTPIENLAPLVHASDTLLLVDAVTSLSGMELRIDDWGIDACFSGTQKCLSCPPGLSPVTFSPKALEVMDARKTKVQSWYLDMAMLRNYWGSSRVYHHTAPINMTYALREALIMVVEEGLDARIARHRENHERLRAGLEKLGLNYIPEQSLTMLNAIHAPEGVDESDGRKWLLEEYDLEIGAGLGPFAGKAWRIGLMGHGCTRRNVDLVLAALGELLDH